MGNVLEKEVYIELIKKALKSNVKKVELISQTSNKVFKIITNNQEILYAKFYINRSSHIDNELKLYNMVNNKYLKELVYYSDNPKFAIYKEIIGKTIDELSENEIEYFKDRITKSVIDFFEEVCKNKADGYGIIDENMNGTSKTFKDFIISRQESSSKILKDYPELNKIFSKIYEKYSDIIIGDNSIVPIDTNMKNIIITKDEKIKFIDPGELISGPVLMGYGDFVAHTYKTKLYYSLISKLNLEEKEKKQIRIYAIFSSLNILAFLKESGVNELDKIIPYGNKYTFYELIKEHLDELDIKY